MVGLASVCLFFYSFTIFDAVYFYLWQYCSLLLILCDIWDDLHCESKFLYVFLLKLHMSAKFVHLFVLIYPMNTVFHLDCQI